MGNRNTNTDTHRRDTASAIEPRLLRRPAAAAYLGVSVPTFDSWRLQGHIRQVPMPATRHDGETLRIPLFDRNDLDALVERLKREGGVS